MGISVVKRFSIESLARWCVAISIFLIPAYIFRFSLGPLKSNVFEVAVLLAFLSTFYFMLSTKRRFRFGPLWPYLFLAIALVAVFIAPDKEKALGIWKGWFLVPFALYWTILQNFKRENIGNLLPPLLLSSSIVTLLAILQHYEVLSTLFYQNGDSSFMQYLEQKRIFGISESPNYLSMYLVPVIFLLAPLQKNKSVRLLVFVFVILSSWVVLLTSSRAGFLALAVGLIAVLFLTLYFNKNFPRFVKNIILCIALVLVFCGTVFVASQFSSHFARTTDQDRLKIYHYSGELLKQNYFLGIGLGAYPEKIKTITQDDPYFQSVVLPYALHPHNLYLALWLNLGLLGILSFISLIVLFFKNIWHRLEDGDPVAISLLVAILTILVHGIFDTTYFKNDLSAILWLILALSVILYSKNENDPKN